MVRFLISRPIGVFSIVLALFALGVVGMLNMPVSLLPELNIPEITIHVFDNNSDARQLENNIIAPIRLQLMQLNNLISIESSTTDESSIVKLRFAHGTNIEYSFIEANEKIDELSPIFIGSVSRPSILKTSPSDIPVFYIRIGLSDKVSKDPYEWLALSKFVNQVIKRRLEQLNEIAFVDINGLEQEQIIIIPNELKINTLGITYDDIIKLLNENNLNLGSLLFKDGHYQYHVRFATHTKTIAEIRSLKILKNGKILMLSEIAEVLQQPIKKSGYNIVNKSNAITLAVYKQPSARVQSMHDKVNQLINEVSKDNPNISFQYSRDQARLLRVSLSNLEQSLLLGLCCAILIVFIILRSFIKPFIIALSIPISLAISFLFLYLIGISINIISLAGLILGVGMMVDNSIIVTDNINQWQLRGKSIEDACIIGTNEVIRPLISSVLTTCAVFIPLIFLSGIAGSLFFDQAIAVSISLFSSLLVSFSVVPVLYKLLISPKSNSIIRNNNDIIIYEKSLSKSLKNSLITILLFLIIIPIGIVLFILIDKQAFPNLKQKETIIKLEWNEPITASENKNRIVNILESLQHNIDEYEVFAGNQQFTLKKDHSTTSSESEIYIKSKNSQSLSSFQHEFDSTMIMNYKESSYSYHPAENIFDMMFIQNEAPLILKIRPVSGNTIKNSDIEKIKLLISDTKGKTNFRSEIIYELKVDIEKMYLYDITLPSLIQSLKLQFSYYKVSEIKDGGTVVDILLSSETKETFQATLAKSSLSNSNGERIPLSSFTALKKVNALKTIRADHNGEYIPIEFHADYRNYNDVINLQENKLSSLPNLFFTWEGNIYTNLLLLKEMLFILIISLILLYFILAAQFESMLQPIIVLFELLIGISSAIVFLFITNNSFNIMAMIGIIVMSGIVINDSILKVDTINKLRAEGYPLLEAIKFAGLRRFRAIVMTSLTTILAMIPILFYGEIGSELQKPMAIALIGGLFIGTLVSLYLIPLLYFYLYSIKSKK
jgi:multidrug efflux pump subunit AcrB